MIAVIIIFTAYVVCGVIGYVILGHKFVDRWETKHNNRWTGKYEQIVTFPLPARQRLMWALCGPIGLFRAIIHTME